MYIYIYICIYMESTAALGKKFIAQLMICNRCQRKKVEKNSKLHCTKLVLH